MDHGGAELVFGSGDRFGGYEEIDTSCLGRCRVAWMASTTTRGGRGMLEKPTAENILESSEGAMFFHWNSNLLCGLFAFGIPVCVCAWGGGGLETLLMLGWVFVLISDQY